MITFLPGKKEKKITLWLPLCPMTIFKDLFPVGEILSS